MKSLDDFHKKYQHISKHIEKLESIAEELECEDSMELTEALRHIIKFFDDKQIADSENKDFDSFAHKIEEITGVEVCECRDLVEALTTVLDHGDCHEVANVIYLTILAIVHHHHHTNKQ